MLRLDLVERGCRDHRNQSHFSDGQATGGNVGFREDRSESRRSAEGLEESEGDGARGSAFPLSTAFSRLGLAAPKLTISGYSHCRTQSKCCHLAFQAD